MAVKTKAELKNLFKTGMIITEASLRDLIDTFLATLDGGTPDSTGNVNTTMKVIGAIPPSSDWTEYPEGVSEFYTEFLAEDYEDYIVENPSFELLDDGNIAIRTFIDSPSNVAYQYVDNIKDGVFNASFIRLGNTDGTWGDLTLIAKELVPSYLISSDKNTDDPNILASTALTSDILDDLNAHKTVGADENVLGHVKVTGNFRDSDSSKVPNLTAVMDFIDSHGGEMASASSTGHILVDDVTTKINPETSMLYVPDATASTKGVVKVDGSTIKINNHGQLYAQPSSNVDAIERNGVFWSIIGYAEPDEPISNFPLGYSCILISEGSQGIINWKSTIYEHPNSDGDIIIYNHLKEVEVDDSIQLRLEQYIEFAIGGSPYDIHAYKRFAFDNSDPQYGDWENLGEDYRLHVYKLASNHNYGHVKVDGTTIVSNDGVISAVGGGGGSKDFFYGALYPDTSITPSSYGNELVLKFNSNQHSSGITNTSGVFTLKPGSVYKFTFTPTIYFNPSTDYVDCFIGAPGSSSPDSFARFFNPATVSNQGYLHPTTLERIVVPTENYREYSVFSRTPTNGHVSYIQAKTTLVIQEL